MRRILIPAATLAAVFFLALPSQGFFLHHGVRHHGIHHGVYYQPQVVAAPLSLGVQTPGGYHVLLHTQDSGKRPEPQDKISADKVIVNSTVASKINGLDARLNDLMKKVDAISSVRGKFKDSPLLTTPAKKGTTTSGDHTEGKN
jgi:hypothetical protein